jgi:hypothetical protein
MLITRVGVDRTRFPAGFVVRQVTSPSNRRKTYRQATHPAFPAGLHPRRNGFSSVFRLKTHGDGLGLDASLPMRTSLCEVFLQTVCWLRHQQGQILVGHEGATGSGLIHTMTARLKTVRRPRPKRLRSERGRTQWPHSCRTGRTKKQADDHSSVQIHTTVPVGMRMTENRLRQKSALSSYALRPHHVLPSAPPHHKYDHSAAIRLQITMPVRSTAKNLYDAKSANYTIREKSVTPKILQPPLTAQRKLVALGRRRQ